MNPSRLRTRYLRITSFFAGVVVRFLWWGLILARLGLRKYVRRTRPKRLRRDAARFRALAIRMGGVMIKVGQFLSSRLDVLPAEVTDELAGLQDEVPAESFDEIRELAESELGVPLSEKFEWVDQEALAAASLGQVHRARLRLSKTGDDDSQDEVNFREVVIKVQRPHIESIVDIDLSALRRVGHWLMRYRPIREHADVPALLREFSAAIGEEIDYLHEAQNAEIFYENFTDDPNVHVPRVVSSHTTRRVLTLEDVYAIKITDYDAITAAGIDRGEVARKLLDTYLRQIFEDDFVHADPHPGNLFVTPLKFADDEPTRWQLTFVDFGMAVRIPDTLRSGLRELVIAVGLQDAARVVRSYQMLNMLLPGADLKAIEQAEAQVFDRFWGMSMRELRQVNPAEIRQFAHQYRDLMFSMPFQIPQNLLLLARTVAILSGMCTGLDPDFNLWNQLTPFARKLVQQEVSSGLDQWLDELGDFLRTLLALPSQANRALARVEAGELVIQSPHVEQEVRSLARSVDRLTGGMVFAALLLGGVWLYNSGSIMFGEGLMGVSAAVLLWMMFFARKR